MTNDGRRPSRQAGIALLVIAAVLWSANGLGIKVLHGMGVSGWSIAAWRSLFAALALSPWAWRRRHPLPDRAWVAATVVVFSAMCTTFVLATTWTTAANAIILQYTAPLWVFLGAPLLLGEAADRSQWIALVAALGGVAVIFGSQFTTDTAGLTLGLTSGLVFGVQTLLFRRVRFVDPLVLAWLTCTGSALLLIVPATVLAGGVPDRSCLMWLAALAVVQFAIPYVCYSAALGRVTAQQAVLIVLLEAVLNPVWVWLAIGERPHPGTIIGGVVILAGVFYLAGVRAPRVVRS